MAITIMIQEDGIDQGETFTVSFECDNEDWEEECYQLGCKVARKVAIRILEAMEERLFQQRPKDWEVEDTKKRTRVTRFGEIPVWRRLYKDEKGNYYLDFVTLERRIQMKSPFLWERPPGRDAQNRVLEHSPTNVTKSSYTTH